MSPAIVPAYCLESIQTVGQKGGAQTKFSYKETQMTCAWKGHSSQNVKDTVSTRRELDRGKALGACSRVSPRLWLSPTPHMHEKTLQRS